MSGLQRKPNEGLYFFISKQISQSSFLVFHFSSINTIVLKAAKYLEIKKQSAS